MADPIQNLPAAKDAYEASLHALDKAHQQQQAILAAQPVDWTAYDAATSALTELRAAADAAQGVYQAALLDAPAVQALITSLKAVTDDLKQRADRLKQDAQSFKDLAQAADAVTKVLSVVAKYA